MLDLSLSRCSAAFALCLLAAAPMARADERADQLLKEVERATKAVPALSADLQVTLTTQNLAVRPGAPVQPTAPGQNNSGFVQGSEPVSFTYTGTVKLQRPNLERIELPAPILQTIASDGTSRWTLLQASREYIKNSADPQGKSQGDYAPILMFFAPETARTAAAIQAPAYSGADNFVTRYLGKERVTLKVARRQPGEASSGQTSPEEFDVVEVRQLRPQPQAVKLYINADKMVTRVVSESRRGTISTVQDISLLHLKPVQRFEASEFAFELPANARPYALPPAPPR
jgi:hypothetical protein